MPLTQTKLGCVNPNQLLSLRLINGLKVPQILLRSIGHLLGLHVHSSLSPARENHSVFTFVLSCPLEHLRCHPRYDFAVLAVSEIALPTRQLEIQRDNKAGMDGRTSASIPAYSCGYGAVLR